jgi:hypothetical protein
MKIVGLLNIILELLIRFPPEEDQPMAENNKHLPYSITVKQRNSIAPSRKAPENPTNY